MACEVLKAEGKEPRGRNISKRVDLGRFQLLHYHSRRLICDWKEQAVREIDCEAHLCFEPFILGWIAFNGWACCVTEETVDAKYLKLLFNDKPLNELFEVTLRANEVMETAVQFRDLWPIFSSRDLGYGLTERGSRRETIESYRERLPAASFKPACAFAHGESNEQIPLDLSHTVSAIYQVRCNLFHGYKGVHSEQDVVIVSRAFRVLVHLLRILMSD